MNLKINYNLEDIGFYTLSNERAKTASESSPLQRCELLITDACNFHCPYCRGVNSRIKGQLTPDHVEHILQLWFDQHLQNIRFTGGEPTLYPNDQLNRFINLCKSHGVKHIAMSTNGSASKKLYDKLIESGINDFSISLDGACCATGDIMSGGAIGAWNKVVDNIKYLSKQVYVSIGMVFTEHNVHECVKAVKFADSLGVSDIRVIPSAQYNQALTMLTTLPNDILMKYSILRYRIDNMIQGRHIRGLSSSDNNHCPLILDDMAIAGHYHYPCVIYMREGGSPIGSINEHIRQERKSWFLNHDTHMDPICRNNCLDVCVDYNNKWREYHS